MDNSGFIKVAVTVDYFYPNEEVDIVRALLYQGFHFVHIRKPGSTYSEMKQLIEAIPVVYRSRITIHDHFSLAYEYGLGGIHLNSRNPKISSSWEGRVSASCHSTEECLAQTNVDYVTLSPIFPSLSKPGYRRSLDSSILRKFLIQKNRPPVIGMGGITKRNIKKIKELGFNGAAMLSDVWRNNFEIEKFLLQFITHPNSKEDALNQAINALKGGCRWIQLRWKEACDEDYLDAARLIQPACKRFNSVFLLNDRVNLVKPSGADGVHLGKNDMPVKEARLLIGPGAIIGKTANTPEDLMEGILAGADYIGMGPFRFTGTKKNLSPILGLEGYRKAITYMRLHQLSIPIVAVGGITDADIHDVMSTGVDGVAISGNIIQAASPIKATEQISKELSFEKIKRSL